MKIFDIDEGDRELLRQVIGLPIPKLSPELLHVLYGKEEEES